MNLTSLTFRGLNLAYWHDTDLGETVVTVEFYDGNQSQMVTFDVETAKRLRNKLNAALSRLPKPPPKTRYYEELDL